MANQADIIGTTNCRTFPEHVSDLKDALISPRRSGLGPPNFQNWRNRPQTYNRGSQDNADLERSNSR